MKAGSLSLDCEFSLASTAGESHGSVDGARQRDDSSLEFDLSRAVVGGTCLRPNNLDVGDLYRRHWAEIQGYVRKTFGAGPPDPEDIAQQAFLNLFATKNSGAIDNPRAFLFRAAYNAGVDSYRQAAARLRASRAEAQTTQGDSAVLGPERVLMGKERLQILADIVKQMPENRRRSFLLHRVHGHSCAEIARRTGYSEAGVKKHIYQAMAELDARLSDLELKSGGKG